MENTFTGLTKRGKKFEVRFCDDHYNIADLIELTNNTQESFAVNCNIPLTTLKSKIGNEKSLDMEQLVKICKYCNIDAMKLYPPEED